MLVEVIVGSVQVSVVVYSIIYVFNNCKDYQ
jgi:hypothetical protein